MNPSLERALKHAIDTKTKPLGSLGRLEALAFQIGMLQGTVRPRMDSCGLTIFAGDHGLVVEGVSAFPQEVTQQMVLNFLSGGAAANVFAEVLDIDLQVVDAGVAGDPIDHPKLVSHRLGPGTANSMIESALSEDQFHRALEYGQGLGSAATHDAVCFGEMGIGNTSAATLLFHKILGLDLGDLVGRGTGVDDEGFARKAEVLARAAERTGERLPAEVALREYGGFEIAMMTGAMIAAAKAKRMVIVDGFIATAAAVVAIETAPDSRKAMVFAHASAERGHHSVLNALKIEPLLSLGMRLGEGTGALLAWPLIKSAAAMLNNMASFESAGVSERE